MRCHICLRAVIEKRMKTSNSDSAFVSLHDHNSTAWYHFFCMLRCMKTYLRSTMKQERLNSIMTLHINKELTDKLELLEIANDFISKSSHGNNYLENSDFNYYH